MVIVTSPGRGIGDEARLDTADGRRRHGKKDTTIRSKDSLSGNVEYSSVTGDRSGASRPAIEMQGREGLRRRIGHLVNELGRYLENPTFDQSLDFGGRERAVGESENRVFGRPEHLYRAPLRDTMIVDGRSIAGTPAHGEQLEIWALGDQTTTVAVRRAVLEVGVGSE